MEVRHTVALRLLDIILVEIQAAHIDYGQVLKILMATIQN
jgi:hypothetical protein